MLSFTDVKEFASNRFAELKERATGWRNNLQGSARIVFGL
jgi:hypothetical protein